MGEVVQIVPRRKPPRLTTSERRALLIKLIIHFKLQDEVEFPQPRNAKDMSHDFLRAMPPGGNVFDEIRNFLRQHKIWPDDTIGFILDVFGWEELEMNHLIELGERRMSGVEVAARLENLERLLPAE